MAKTTQSAAKTSQQSSAVEIFPAQSALAIKLKKILSRLQDNIDENESSMDFYDEVSEYTEKYQDSSDLMQDFQTLIKQVSDESASALLSDLQEEKELATKYVFKLIFLHNFIVTIDTLLNSLSDLTDKPNNYRQRLTKTSLYHRIVSLIPNGLARCILLGFTEVINNFDKNLFEYVKDATYTEYSEIATENCHRRFFKEFLDTLGVCLLQKAQLISTLDDNMLKKGKNTEELKQALITLAEQHVTDTNNKLAWPIRIMLFECHL